MKFLVKFYKKHDFNIHPVDRWGLTPLEEAKGKLQKLAASTLDPSNLMCKLKLEKIVALLERDLSGASGDDLCLSPKSPKSPSLSPRIPAKAVVG